MTTTAIGFDLICIHIVWLYLAPVSIMFLLQMMLLHLLLQQLAPFASLLWRRSESIYLLHVLYSHLFVHRVLIPSVLRTFQAHNGLLQRTLRGISGKSLKTWLWLLPFHDAGDWFPCSLLGETAHSAIGSYLFDATWLTVLLLLYTFDDEIAEVCIWNNCWRDKR